MVDTAPIEKKSLEAHVDLCAERYKSMANNIEGLDKKVDRLEMMINEVHGMVQKMAQRRTDQLLGCLLYTSQSPRDVEESRLHSYA